MTPTVLEIALAPHVRSEKAEEALCDDFVARGGGRQRVVRFSQPRNTMQTPGISDRRYRIAGLCFWWEVKAANGKLRPDQVDFLEQELAYGNAVGVGTLEDLIAYHNTLLGAAYGPARLALGCELGKNLIEKYRIKHRPAKRGKL